MVRAASPIAYLTDIIEAIELVGNDMAGISLAIFEADIRKRWLVERGIEIVSEASQSAPSGNSLAQGRWHRQRAAPQLLRHRP